LQLVNVVTFLSELRMRHEYNRYRIVSERNSSKELDFELVYCVLHKLMGVITCILINEMFYNMHVLTIIITCTFIAELEVQENKFGSYMRIGVMEYSQGYCIHEEEIRCLHVSMRNVET
jgi:hypothetical protein